MRYEKRMIRDEARKKGKTYYYTGEPCLNGHTARRYTSNSSCVTCSHERNKLDKRTIANIKNKPTNIEVEWKKLFKIKLILDRILEVKTD